MRPVGGRVGVSRRCLVDVRCKDPRARVVLTLSHLLPAVRAALEPAAAAAFERVCEGAAARMGSAFAILERIPQTPDGTTDLRFVQGSGFYTRDGGAWLYHKGAGSVEALAGARVGGRLDLAYPSFGAEVPGEEGAFSWGSVFGVKLLSGVAREFLHTAILMIHSIEEHALTSFEAVARATSIPVCAVVLPGLTERLRAGMADKPEGIRQEVGRKLDGGDCGAKLLLITPDAVRATDHRDVEGKWAETRNVFRRTLALDPSAVLHAGERNPYLRPDLALKRGQSIDFMARHGFLYDPSSSHLQNFYASARAPARAWFPAADLGDAFPRHLFDVRQQVCLLANSLSGWRMAENLAPSLSDDPGAGPGPGLERLGAFLSGVRPGGDARGLSALFALVPKSAAVGLAAAIIADGQPESSPADLYRPLLATVQDKAGFGQVNAADLDRERAACERLTGALVHLRPRGLVDLVRRSDRGGAGALWRPARAALDELWAQGDGAAALGALEWLIEAWCGEQGRVDADTLAEVVSALPRDARAIEGALSPASSSRLKAILDRPGELGSPAAALEATFEEGFNGRAVSHRRWIEACCRDGDPVEPFGWAEEMLDALGGLFEDPAGIVEDYLGFMFKTRGLLDYMVRGDRRGLGSAISGSGRRDVHRPYVVLRAVDPWTAEAAGFRGDLPRACRAMALLLLPRFSKP